LNILNNVNGQYEEIFNIPDHKGNANQNDIEISPLFSQNGYLQEHKQMLMRLCVWWGGKLTTADGM
jgi:hypothetical protein